MRKDEDLTDTDIGLRLHEVELLIKGMVKRQEDVIRVFLHKFSLAEKVRLLRFATHTTSKGFDEEENTSHTLFMLYFNTRVFDLKGDEPFGNEDLFKKVQEDFKKFLVAEEEIPNKS
jgi:hypothetical protein